MEDERRQFEAIFKNNRDRVFRLCCMYTGDFEERKDLMQEIFIRIWEHMSSFRGESSMSTWVYRIATNTCLMHIRYEKKRPPVYPLPDHTEFMDMEAVVEERPAITIDRLMVLVHQLPAFERTLVSLYLEDLSGKEMAQITGLSEANIRVRIHRLKARLREDLKELTFNNVRHGS